MTTVPSQRMVAGAGANGDDRLGMRNDKWMLQESVLLQSIVVEVSDRETQSERMHDSLNKKASPKVALQDP